MKPGSVYFEPILMVTGSGNIMLMVGMSIVELENISGSIIIDSVLQGDGPALCAGLSKNDNCD